LSGYGTAAVMNVTIVDASAPGYVTALHDGIGLGTSNLNAFQKGQTIANLVTTPLSWSDAHHLYSSGGGHLLVDLQGAFI
jgi:hypothetical protein